MENLKYEYGCKLPASYGQGVYEERPDFVEDPPTAAAALPKEEDEYEWGDPGFKQNGDVKAKPAHYCSLVKAAGNNFYLAPGETLEQCPYDENHQILSQKFSSHLTKCRRNYIKRQESQGEAIHIDVCEFNYMHHIPTYSMHVHARTCEATIRHFDRLDYIRQLSAAEESPNESTEGAAAAGQDCTDREPIKNADDNPDENWELAPPVKPYNGVERLAEEGSCFITPYGMTKSERKEFRKNESRRTFLIRERRRIVADKQIKDREEACSSEQSKRNDRKFVKCLKKMDKEIEIRSEIFKEYMYLTRPSDDWYEEEEPPYKRALMEDHHNKYDQFN